MLACLWNLGINPELLDIDEAIDILFCAMRCFPPKICSIQDFYQGIFPPEDTEKKLKDNKISFKQQGNKPFPFGNSISTAAEYTALAKTGLVVDNRKKSKKSGNSS